MVFNEEWAVKVNAALFQSELVCRVEFDKCNLGVSSKFTFPTESVGQKNAELNSVICVEMNVVLSPAKSKTPFSRCITSTNVQASQSSLSQLV